MAEAPSDEAALHFLSDLELLDTATPDARLCLQFGHKYAVGRRPEVPPAGATAVYVRTSVASRMHLLVSQHPTDLWLQGTPVWGVTDLGSMNGTWINGYRLPAHTWRELRHDDVINIGEKSALRWRVEQPLQPPAASHAAAAGAAAAAEAAPAPAASAPGAALIHGEAGAAAAQAPSSNDARSTTLGDWVEPQPAASHAIAPYGAQHTEAPQSFGDDPREVAMHAAAAAKVAAVQAADAAAALAADPTLDVGGFDARSKLKILIELAFGLSVDEDDIPVKGITELAPVDFEYARMQGGTIKLLGCASAAARARVWARRPAAAARARPRARASRSRASRAAKCRWTN